jgi:hypothetical protein
MADDLFGFLDPNVPKSLIPPEGYEGVHQPGNSWARQGDRTANTSWLTVDQYNHIIAQFRGLATLAAVDVSDLIQSSPLLLRTFIQRTIEAVLSGVDLGDDYLVMRKADYDADLDGKVDLAAGGTGVSATDAADLRSKLGVTSAIDTAISAIGAVVVNKGSWSAATGAFPGGAKNGWAYVVTVAGTVGGVDFNVGDRVLALADNASTSVYAGNWLKLDYTDQVLSVAGLTGAITVAGLRTALGLAAVALSGAYGDLSGRPTLGNSAARNVGTTAGTVAAGDDSRIVGAAQSGDLASVATSGSYNDLTDKPAAANPKAAAKAWVNFNGTGTVAIRDSFNVASITDNGAGNYTINFTTPMANANYVVFALARRSTGGVLWTSIAQGGVYTASAVTVEVRNSNAAAEDPDIMSVVVFGS